MTSTVQNEVFGLIRNSTGTAPASLDQRLGDDLKLDSLDFVRLLMDLEDNFGVKIPGTDAVGFATVGDVVRYLEAHP